MTELWSCLIHISSFRYWDFIETFGCVRHGGSRLRYDPTIPFTLLI